MGERIPPVTLEEDVSSDPKIVRIIRESIIKALFSQNEADRKNEISYLRNFFGGLLVRGYVEDCHMFLDKNVDGHLRTILVGNVPRPYLDKGQYDFRVN